MQKNIKFEISKFISSFVYVGFIKKAPGTFGSLAAFPFIWIINTLIMKFAIKDDILDIEYLIKLFIYHLTGVIILFIIGVISSHIYSKHSGKEDPKEVVIDEVVGQWLLVCLTSPIAIAAIDTVPEILSLFMMFIAFRIFDILKPWPINWFDKNIKGGLGIMLDDVVAAFMGTIIFYGIFLMVLEK